MKNYGILFLYLKFIYNLYFIKLKQIEYAKPVKLYGAHCTDPF